MSATAACVIAGGGPAGIMLGLLLARAGVEVTVLEKHGDFLRERKARYLVGTPKSWLRHHEATLLEQTDWQQVQDGLEVRLVEHPDGQPNEKYVLCRSTARAEKERAMLQRQSDTLTAALVKIDAWLRRSPQTDLENVGRRIGQLRSHPFERCNQ